jgi:hypothetical protein
MITGIIAANEFSLYPVTDSRILIDSGLVAMSMTGTEHIYVVTPIELASGLTQRFSLPVYRSMGIFPRIIITHALDYELFETLRGDFTLFMKGNRWVTPQAFADGLAIIPDSSDNHVFIGACKNWFTFIYPKNVPFKTMVHEIYPISYGHLVTNMQSYLSLLLQEQNYANLWNSDA